MRISDWSSDVCSSDLCTDRSVGCDDEFDQYPSVLARLFRGDRIPGRGCFDRMQFVRGLVACNGLVPLAIRFSAACCSTPRRSASRCSASPLSAARSATSRWRSSSHTVRPRNSAWPCSFPAHSLAASFLRHFFDTHHSFLLSFL